MSNILGAVIVPVTPFTQNATLFWCKATMRGAWVDPGGDLPALREATRAKGVTIEKILLTHGHIDHAGEAGIYAAELGVPIEGPHRDDLFWLESLEEVGRGYGLTDARAFVPDRWLDEGDRVSVGEVTFNVHHTPGHTPGHVIFHQPEVELAQVGDVLFQGSIGRTDFPRGSHADLIASIRTKLWPLGDATRFIPGHGGMSTFGAERRSNPYVSDQAAAQP
jgi:hydroxyacylglutathione hydrolase